MAASADELWADDPIAAPPGPAPKGKAGKPEPRPDTTTARPLTGPPRLGSLRTSRTDAIRDRLDDIRAAGADMWERVPLGLRQRLVAGAALIAIVAVLIFVVLPVAPCWVPGGDRCVPEDEALALVPADALAYAHINLGTDTDQYEDAAGLAERLPTLAADALAALPSATGRLVDYDRDIRPWSNGEAALVVDSQGLEVERLLMFEVEDAEAAAEFGSSRLGFGAATSDVSGVEISVDSDGFAWAIDGGFLMLGPEASVRRALRVAAGEEEPLAEEPDAAAARELLPEDRIADIWISPELAAITALDKDLGGLDTFINEDATEGAAVSLSLRDDSIEVAVRSLQDPDVSEAAADFFSTLPDFEPELPESIGGDALAYLGLGSPSEAAEGLLAQAAKAAPDLLAGFERFSERLAKREGIAIERELLPLFEGEVAITVEPSDGPAPDASAPATPGLAPEIGAPYVALVADGVDTEAALETMAGLQAPIAEAVAGSAADSGAAPPLFETREIAGVEAAGLQVSPVVELTYAAYDDRLVVGSSPLAVERARSVDAQLAADDKFEEATEDLPDDPSLLAYLDVRDLLTLGERIGLATDPAYARLAGDLRTLEAAALSVRRADDLLATDLRISVGEPEPAAPDPPVLEVEPG